MYHFIINPNSKSGKAINIWHKIEDILKEKSINYIAYQTEYAGHAVKITRKICKTFHSKKTIIIVGGDGTVNEVINGLPSYKDITIGYIPTGSGNDLARGLGISIEPMSALNNILYPKKYYYTDTGLLTTTTKNRHIQRKFIVSSGIGYDAEVCKHTLTSKLKKVLNKLHLGKLTYLLIGISQIMVSRSSDGEIIINEFSKIRLNNIFFIAAMIQKSEGGGLKMTPSAKNNDGLLELCIVSGIGKARIFYTIPALFFGKHVNMKGIKIITCRNAQIKTNTPLTVHTDGEINGSLNHIKFTCTEEKLRFIV